MARQKIESEILKEIEALLAPHCVWLARINGGKFLMKGRGTRQVFTSYRLFVPPEAKDTMDERLPDLLGQIKSGTLIAVEVKKPGGTVTDAQAAFLHRVQGIGGIAAICYGADDADEVIDRIKEDIAFHDGLMARGVLDRPFELTVVHSSAMV